MLLSLLHKVVGRNRLVDKVHLSSQAQLIIFLQIDKACVSDPLVSVPGLIKEL